MGRPRTQALQCKATGCRRKARAKGFCELHLYRFNKYGTFEKPDKPSFCSVDGCSLARKTKSFCNKHYQRFKKYGNPLAPRKRKHNGIYNCNGYVILTRPTHPNARKNGLVPEHIVVMSEILGRPLRKGEVVHHRNGIRNDNKPGNLELRTVSTHPPGQSVKDMIHYCREYLAKYEADYEKLKRAISQSDDSPNLTQPC